MHAATRGPCCTHSPTIPAVVNCRKNHAASGNVSRLDEAETTPLASLLIGIGWWCGHRGFVHLHHLLLAIVLAHHIDLGVGGNGVVEHERLYHVPRGVDFQVCHHRPGTLVIDTPHLVDH